MKRAIGSSLPTYILAIRVLLASLNVVDGTANCGVWLCGGIEIDNSRLS